MLWTREALHDLVRDRLSNYHFMVVANREPYIHQFDGEQIVCLRPASGMVTAVDPILAATGGTWVAHGSGTADRETVDANDRVMVPPEDPQYTLRRVWLTKEEEEGYYYGMANGGLWPLCHTAFTRPVFTPRDWEYYRAVNQRFADVVVEEAGDRPTIVFIQDFHYCLLPRLLKQRNPNLILAHFWHIPWPHREAFRTFPWKEELLDGLLGNDVLGFHIHYHCQNFLDTVDRTIEARVEPESYRITRGGKVTQVKPFPISIDYADHQRDAVSPEVEAEMTRWKKRLRLRGEHLGVGIERLDYTKGIPDRLRSLDYLLETRPELRGKLRFVQVAVPSRTHIPAYQHLNHEVDELVEAINWRWQSGAWKPIVYIKEHQPPASMMALHRLADFFCVSSLHDGMNLVAKEFVASRVDGDGVLILSRFTGAARELTDALLVNPYAMAETADAIHQAITMPPEERQRRMRRMRETVESNGVFRWAAKILSALLKLDLPETS